MIGGADCALTEGQIAGYAASGQVEAFRRTQATSSEEDQRR